jgi:leucyl-tRNA synthetase
MAVPCGDERDFAFAKHFNLPIPNIFNDADISETACSDKQAVMANSDFLNGLTVDQASKLAIDKIEELNIGVRKINYRMRDAGFSRQRYWGEPFPIVYDDNNTPYALPETDLPLQLPHLESYSAGPEGKGPLANAHDWVKIASDHVHLTQKGVSHGNAVAGMGSHYTRETDTMPGFAGSSWYYLRYMDPHNAAVFCDKKISDYWNQVDVYVGGAEHAVGHLLYSRMWCKVLYDLGYISFDEPYKKLINQGMIQGNSRLVYRIKNTNTFVSAGLKDQYETDTLYAEYKFCDGLELDLHQFKNWREEYKDAEFILENGKYFCGSLVEKMSKRLFNVVNPDDIIEQYGTDTFRMYEMFLGPLEVSKPWDTKGIEGVHRFLKKWWRLYVDEQNGLSISKEKATAAEMKILHQTLKKIAADIEHFAFNTSVSQFMICINELSKLQCNKREILQPLLIALNPFAPHISAELWQMMGNESSILDAAFPQADEKYLIENTFRYPVAINGKTRTEYELALDLDVKDIENLIMQDENIIKWMDGKPLKKFIFVKARMINVVV